MGVRIAEGVWAGSCTRYPIPKNTTHNFVSDSYVQFIGLKRACQYDTNVQRRA